jgi:hypothetical protein
VTVSVVKCCDCFLAIACWHALLDPFKCFPAVKVFTILR